VKKSDLERAFDTQLRALGHDLPEPLEEYRFHPTRKWSVDRAWMPQQVAIEIEGGSYGKAIKCHNCKVIVRARKNDGSLGRQYRVGGGHQTTRFSKDIAKYNALSCAGWILLRYTHDDIHGDPHSMITELREALDSRAYRLSMVGSLSEQQTKIMYLIAAGLRGNEIAKRLDIKENYVGKSVQMVCEKLVVNNRASAVARAIAWGLIELDQIPWTGPIGIDNT
jgi:DNA-binding CsgD family transcriptional regulator